MHDKSFTIVEEDGIVIYDESDDYDPAEDNISESSLKTNEEIFTEEYMMKFSQEMDYKIVREKRNQRLVSISVIFTIILYISLLTYIFF